MNKYCKFIYSGATSLPCTPGITPYTVFDYFTKHSSKYDLTKVEIHKHTDDTVCLEPNDYLLTYSSSTEKQPIQFGERWRTRRDITEYDSNVAIYFRPSNDIVMTLPFFVLLGNKKEFYPRRQLLSSISSIRRRHRASSGMDPISGTETDTGTHLLSYSCYKIQYFLYLILVVTRFLFCFYLFVFFFGFFFFFFLMFCFFIYIYQNV